MSNLLGVNFFRLVSEASKKEWSQVYAKISFDEDEILSKGGIFGVVQLSGGDDVLGRGSELVSLLEEEFNGFEGDDILIQLFRSLSKTESSLEFVLAQILINPKIQERELRVITKGGAWVEMSRERRVLRLIDRNSSGKVVRGRLFSGDRLVLATGELERIVGDKAWTSGNTEELVEGWNYKLLNSDTVGDGVMAGLILDVGEFSGEWKNNGGQLSIDNVRIGSETVVEGVLERQSLPILKKKRFLWGLRRNKSLKIREVGSVGNTKKWPVFVGGAFLLLLFVSVGFGWRDVREKKVKEEFVSVYEPLVKKHDDAMAMFDLNAVGARSLMEEVVKETKIKKVEFEGSRYAPEWDSFVKKLDTDWQVVSGQFKENGKEFFDLSIVRDALLGQRLVLGEDSVFVADDRVGVVKINMKNKSSEVLMGGGSDWRDVAIVKSVAVVLDKGGFVYNGGGFEWKSGVNLIALSGFGDNLYALDSKNGEIWKYKVSIANGKVSDIGERKRWLVGDSGVLFGGAVDLDIDGDVWVAKKKNVIRLRRGVEEKFKFLNAPDDLSIDRLVVWGVSEEGNIVVLDKKSSRLVVFAKDTGEYKKQIVWNDLSKADDLIFVDKNKVLVLVGGGLYEMAL